MSLKDIMGSAYKDGITVEEIVAFFENNSKIVNLSNGGYVSKEKFDDIKEKYDTLTENTKDYEDIKSKYDGLVAKQTKDGELATIGKYVQPDFAEFVHFQLKNGNKLGEKLEDNVKEYLKNNSAYAIPREPIKKNKVIQTFTETSGTDPVVKTNNQKFNDMLRRSANREQ